MLPAYSGLGLPLWFCNCLSRTSLYPPFFLLCTCLRQFVSSLCWFLFCTLQQHTHRACFFFSLCVNQVYENSVWIGLPNQFDIFFNHTIIFGQELYLSELPSRMRLILQQYFIKIKDYCVALLCWKG